MQNFDRNYANFMAPPTDRTEKWVPPGGAENAGVENAGAITYGKPPKEKTVRYQ